VAVAADRGLRVARRWRGGAGPWNAYMALALNTFAAWARPKVGQLAHAPSCACCPQFMFDERAHS